MSRTRTPARVELAGKTRDEVVVNFPAFTNQTLEGTMSWQGSFVGAVQGAVSKGPMGGPTVFFDPQDPKLETVVIGSALDNFKSTSAGPGTTWNGKSAWVPGTSGTIKSLPAGYTQTFMLHAGSTSGITAAISEWGGLLQACAATTCTHAPFSCRVLIWQSRAHSYSGPRVTG